MEALPPTARLLHVGLMKTGTTALQVAASHRRRALLQHGVRYPGWHYNQRSAALDMLERTSDGARAHPDDWDRLLAQINADHTRRILISNELIAVADEAAIRRFRADLGPLTHIAFTVRSFSSVLPSLWQQYVKSGHRRDFEHFLRRRLGPKPPRDMARHDQGALVENWVRIFGPDNVTVIVVDKSEPRRAASAFETMLGLPDGMLFEPVLSGESLNRSLSMPEASLVLMINKLLRPYDLDQSDIDRLVFSGASARMLDVCPPPDRDSQIILPPWAVEPAVAVSRRYAEAIASTGVRVVGDLAELGRPPRTDRGQWQLSDSVPVEVAAQAVLGTVSSALQGGRNFGLPNGVAPHTKAATFGHVRWLASGARRQAGRLRYRLRGRAPRDDD